jgi:lipid-binding SYLF domain-containing protein
LLSESAGYGSRRDQAVKDKAIPDKIMQGAKCIAVVPSMVKIAVGFGGNHGKGVATCRTEHGWSAPAPITITGGSWGLQLGGQAIDLVMVVMNEDGMEHLLSSKFKLGADASAAAGPVGRDTAADTDIKMKSEVVIGSGAVCSQESIFMVRWSVKIKTTHLLLASLCPFLTF